MYNIPGLKYGVIEIEFETSRSVVHDWRDRWSSDWIDRLSEPELDIGNTRFIIFNQLEEDFYNETIN